MGGECLQPSTSCVSDNECCDSGYGNPIVGFDQYCSYGRYENHPLTEMHCCEEGWYWNPEELQCWESASCYDPSISDYCNTLLTSQNIGEYIVDSGCISEQTNQYGYWESCCNSNQYGGTPGYFYCEITPL